MARELSAYLVAAQIRILGHSHLSLKKESFSKLSKRTNFIPRGENLSITSQNRLRIETGTNRLLFFFQ